MSIFSSPEQLDKIQSLLSKYLRLPFARTTIPGSVMESVFAHVRSANVLNTYDFVDVISTTNQRGWQIKSTKEKTPVTWKRAKLPDAPTLIKESYKTEQGLQNLGDSIIEFCNQHILESINLYNLNEIGYSRIIIHDNQLITYFERLLCTRESPILFNVSDFQWQWSKPKKNVKKEQLPALHGIHIPTEKKWWAWHGLGENQLHFSGERAWWPNQGDSHAITFCFPSEEEKLSLDDFIKLLSDFD
ncbi:hypothetical protein PMG71_06720 [Roseofilum sp. BLCC_M154]|uniref:Uncharacterized protein n=1 Tax=Roseofilum acuticapitatum BLCC-M154 TaxID=3022444 RepID=A0ABT7AQF4_9CYAN|nr:hypothetical protein [Roseofilum acuticapitatum]MDJ1169115.1 hypothetical protein [Roseofilum acuticapitatum BLCC-M154]